MATLRRLSEAQWNRLVFEYENGGEHGCRSRYVRRPNDYNVGLDYMTSSGHPPHGAITAVGTTWE